MHRWYSFAKAASHSGSPSAATRDTTSAGFEVLDRPGQMPRASGSVVDVGL